MTLGAERPREPEVAVYGTQGRLTLRYTRDELLLGDAPPRVFSCTDLLENLLAHVRHPQVPLVAPLERFIGFTRVVDAIAAAPPPTAIPGSYWQLVDDENGPRRVIPGIDALVAGAAAKSRLFREAGAPWAGSGKS